MDVSVVVSTSTALRTVHCKRKSAGSTLGRTGVERAVLDLAITSKHG